MKVRFLVDGFNLYHSVKAAEKHLAAGPLRWLNLYGLCDTLLRSTLGPGNTLVGVHYFSALAKHLERKKPDVVQRHKTFIAAIESTGVEVTLANFRRKVRPYSLADMKVQIQPIRCWFSLPTSRVRLSAIAHEEKETDVAIACRLLELLHHGQCDAAILLTGDTDIAPAIRTAKRLHPAATIGVAFPFKRHNRDLERLVGHSRQHQRTALCRAPVPSNCHVASRPRASETVQLVMSNTLAADDTLQGAAGSLHALVVLPLDNCHVTRYIFGRSGRSRIDRRVTCSLPGLRVASRPIDRGDTRERS